MYKWAVIGAPLGYPVVVLWHGHPAVLDLLAHPLPMLQQFIGSRNVGVGQFIALVLDLGASLVGQPMGVSGTMLVITTQVSSPVLLWPACPIQPASRSQASCPALRCSYLGHPHSHHQGQLYCFRQGAGPLVIAVV